jgi:hypothetical protein
VSARLLLLGGTTEALRLARRLGPETVYSLAGLGRVPDDLACRVRVGAAARERDGGHVAEGGGGEARARHAEQDAQHCERRDE